MSEIIRKEHNVSTLMYHIVCPAKYRRAVINNRRALPCGYLFDDEGFEKDTTIKHETYLENAHDIFQIINGDMIKTNIYINELINIINDEGSDW
jgi:hypothetical protein